METMALALLGGREPQSYMIQIINGLFIQTPPLNPVGLLLQGQHNHC